MEEMKKKNMEREYFLHQIASHRILSSGFCQDSGLFQGKMGISLFFFIYARYVSNHWYEEFAGELLEDVCNGLDINIPITFVDGLCGIGWAIEFMVQSGYVEGNTDGVTYFYNPYTSH